MHKNLIFDMDNTLCDCTPYYTKALDEFVQFTHNRTGIPDGIIRSIVKNIDAECTKLESGFSRTRFPRSFEAASLTADVISGIDLDFSAAEHAYFIADTVFSQPYPLYDGIWEMLVNYQTDRNVDLFLYTMGDYAVQMRKIVINNLTEIFHPDRIYIVPKKNGEALQRIIDDHSLVKSETFVIGDSIKGDIGSANALGIQSIWVRHHTDVAWAYEDEQHTPTFQIIETVQLPSIISYR